jgi:hypothetical protein
VQNLSVENKVERGINSKILRFLCMKKTFVMKVMKIWFILFIVLFAFSKNSLYKMHFARYGCYGEISATMNVFYNKHKCNTWREYGI